MTRSIFGWDLPPGCTQRMIDEQAGTDAVCECCGDYADNCECPECPVCGTSGRPQCYSEHGMKYSKEQLIGQSKQRIANLEQQLDEAKFGLSLLENDTTDY